ncbi:MAG TPA: hypothetical protein VJV58_18980 [Bradyrhizobium sp.]|uniref:hypothetical protein n=1 Tax=Bradyrhizobium sp. TaxID=376 RepID=UPI002B4A32F4|nr:hypothetical protein [Bradyrhizobium sp.]HKO73018.1 hypothetical protein [Bradyrhizobium sp.]
MATITSEALSSAAQGRERIDRLHHLKSFFRQFFLRAFDPYRPELHYMRGPGPACRAKQSALTQTHSG